MAYMKPSICKFIIAATAIAITPLLHAEISLSINIAPPALPIYAQPPIPGEGYLWTPGYWSWNAYDNDYYWIPGTWVAAPFMGALWTPGYWDAGYSGGYFWHRGYWGSHIGYYGGINYGFGYGGNGYQGGYWNHGSFNYNRTVNNITNNYITNVYSSRITVMPHASRVSYNSGHGGVQVPATKNEQMINAMPHNQQTQRQAQHEQATYAHTDSRMAVNHGMPRVAATPEPGSFNSAHIESARAMQPVPSNQQHAQAGGQPAHAGAAPHGGGAPHGGAAHHR